MASSPLYERGDTIREIANQRARPEKNFRAWLDELGLLETPEVYDFTEQEERLWSALMVQAGQSLDRRLDGLLNEIYACDDAFYDLRSHRRLRRLLREINDCRDDLRSFEMDVEEMALVLSTERERLPGHFGSVEIVLGDVKRTYDRAYDLALYKRKKITDGWVTATNILISFLVLVVMMLWWLEGASL